MNKSLSGDTDSVLALQGIGWLTRKALGLATVTQHLKQYPDAHNPSVVHIDFSQTVTGGIKGTTELRTLDWQYRPHSDHFFGDLNGRSRWNTIGKIGEGEMKREGGEADDVKFLKEGWSAESLDGEVVESYVEHDNKGWVGWQVWGFADVDVGGTKQRRHVRNVVVRKGKEVRRIKLVFDWAGKD
ncbi:hypothetical protein K432DRAFT_380151, partial [Lepidopterella palustris CBS 459.81]